MDYYYLALSAPCRGPMLTAKALGIELNLKILDVLVGEQNKPEFLAINPQHCVPTLVDGDLKLWERYNMFVFLYLKNKNKDFYIHSKK